MTAPNIDEQRFTIDDANRMLPLVKAIVTDIVGLAGDLEDRQDRLESLHGDEAELGDPHAEEVHQMQQEIDADDARLDEYIGELVDLGVELQDAINGEVDFRTQIEGQEVLLCWKLGEPEVTYWHTEGDGFAGRQSLLQGATPTGDYSSPETTES